MASGPLVLVRILSFKLSLGAIFRLFSSTKRLRKMATTKSASDHQSVYINQQVIINLYTYQYSFMDLYNSIKFNTTNQYLNILFNYINVKTVS